MVFQLIFRMCLFVAFKAILVDSCNGQCTMDTCVIPYGIDRDDNCNQTSSYVDCVNSSIVQNSLCPTPYRNVWNERIEEMRQLMLEYGCYNNGRRGQLDVTSGQCRLIVVALLIHFALKSVSISGCHSL